MRIQNSPGSYGILAGLLVLLFAAIVNDGCAMTSTSMPGRGAYEALEQAVSIDAVCLAADGSVVGFYGSGVIVNRHTILTAGHVAQDPPGYLCGRVATMSNGHKYSVTAGVVLPDRDLGALVSADAFDPTLSITYGPKPAFGEHICAMVAFPMALWRCGEAQGDDAPPGDVVHTITVEPGNSGSGVYDAQGRLIGIITHRWSCGVTGQLCGGKMASLEGYLHELIIP